MLSPPFLGLLVVFSFVLDCASLPLPMLQMQPGLGACHAHLILTLLKLFGKKITAFDDLVSDLGAQPRALLASVCVQPGWTLTNPSCLEAVFQIGLSAKISVIIAVSVLIFPLVLCQPKSDASTGLSGRRTAS